MSDIVPMLLLLALCVPVFILLIQLELSERRFEELRLMLWSLLPDEPRAILEADLTEKEVRKRNG